MANIYQNLTALISRTPLLQLNQYGARQDLKARLIAKLEYFNPLGSVKDRIAYAMIADAEEKGLLDKDTVIVEPTSGNTGIGLAFVAAARGYRLILTMPETMSLERRALVAALGAEVVLTPGPEGMKGAIRRAQELAAELPKAFIPQQFSNPANPRIHRETTAQEILADTGAFLLLAGWAPAPPAWARCSRRRCGVKIIAVEPSASPTSPGASPGPTKFRASARSFVPVSLTSSGGVLQVDNDAPEAAGRGRREACWWASPPARPCTPRWPS